MFVSCLIVEMLTESAGARMKKKQNKQNENNTDSYVPCPPKEYPDEEWRRKVTYSLDYHKSVTTTTMCVTTKLVVLSFDKKSKI